MESDAAVQRIGCFHGGDRIAVGVAVVAEHAGRRHVQHAIMRYGVRISRPGRRQVLHEQRDGDGGAFERAVVVPIGEAVGPGKARVRRIVERAVSIQRDCWPAAAMKRSRGGKGPDTFAFGPQIGKDVITDFDPKTDIIQFNHALFANYAAAIVSESFDGHNTTFTANHDSNQTVTLQNVAPSSLSPSNFSFA